MATNKETIKVTISGLPEAIAAIKESKEAMAELTAGLYALDDQEWALVRLIRSINSGEISHLDIRKGLPLMVKCGAQVLDLSIDEIRARVIDGKAVAVDLSDIK